MKLKTRLMIAPVLTAAVALSAFGTYGMLMDRQSAQAGIAAGADLADFKALDGVGNAVADVQAGVYRTLAIIDSVNDAQMKAFRAGIAKQIEDARRAAAVIAESRKSDVELNKLVGELDPQLEKYFKDADRGIGFASVDTNMAVGAMKAAEVSHAAFSATMVKILAHTEKAADARAEAAVKSGRQLALLLGAISLLATGLAIGVALVSQRRLLVDINRAVSLSGEVAKGNLDVSVETERKDEIGDLL
ncbi:MAG: hypothetical protein Q8N44_11460, partial [Rubrivivax sp.]|nr:hypothetical protein [Rubrivivax sp.]